MKVIVVGFSKTGTKFMSAALKILGYSVYHWEDHFIYLGDKWIKMLKKGGTIEDFYEMYKNVDAGTGMPFFMFWEEISEAFPEAKIVFLQRSNCDEWEKSFLNQINMFNQDWKFRILPVLSYTGFKFFSYLVLTNRIIFGNHSILPWNFCNRISTTVARKRYRDHCNSVLTSAPRDRLLVCDLRQGWKPLCEFLEKDIPDVDFPHENRRGTLVKIAEEKSPIFEKMQNEMKFSITILGLTFCVLLYYILVKIF